MRVAPTVGALHKVLLELDPPGLLLPDVLLQHVHLNEEASRGFVLLQSLFEGVVRHLQRSESHDDLPRLK